MNAKYINLKGYDWNFDFSRKQRFEIKGKYVVLPEEVGDAFPKYFKKDSVIVTDEPKEIISEDVKVVIDEPKEVQEPVEEVKKVSKRGRKAIK